MKAKALGQGDPLVRVKPKQLLAAGVHRVGKTVDVRDGQARLEDGTALDVATVIWCTGFRHDLSWIELPIFQEDGRPRHERGVVTERARACTSSACPSSSRRPRTSCPGWAATPRTLFEAAGPPLGTDGDAAVAA